MAELTMADLDGRDKARDAELDRRVRAALVLITARIQDVAAHARLALTATALQRQDGRPTLMAFRQGRSYPAACARLNELADAIVKACQQARMFQYRDSFRFYWAALPPEARRPGPGRPPAERVFRCRNHMLHGSSLSEDFDALAGRHKQSLLKTLHAAASRAADEREAAAAISQWTQQAAQSFATAARIALNDSLTFADRMAGRDASRPELLHDDPTIPE